MSTGYHFTLTVRAIAGEYVARVSITGEVPVGKGTGVCSANASFTAPTADVAREDAVEWLREQEGKLAALRAELTAQAKSEVESGPA